MITVLPFWPSSWRDRALKPPRGANCLDILKKSDKSKWWLCCSFSHSHCHVHSRYITASYSQASIIDHEKGLTPTPLSWFLETKDLLIITSGVHRHTECGKLWLVIALSIAWELTSWESSLSSEVKARYISTNVFNCNQNWYKNTFSIKQRFYFKTSHEDAYTSCMSTVKV